MPTKITWADETWNVAEGCAKVSAGCKHCYAERLAPRLGVDFGKLTLHPERLEQPLHWRKPRRVFVCSRSDLWHEDVPDLFIESVFGYMAVAHNHTFMVLTKRPQRMAAWFREGPPLSSRENMVATAAYELTNVVWDSRGSDRANYATAPGSRDRDLSNRRAWPGWPLPNVWLGVSVEDQATAEERLPLLLETPAAKRFVSVEPMLGPVSLDPYLGIWAAHQGQILHADLRTLRDPRKPMPPLYTALERPSNSYLYKRQLDWVIVGGESGPKARQMEVGWVSMLHGECQAAAVPFYMKQDSGPRPGMKGRIPDDLWAVKEIP